MHIKTAPILPMQIDIGSFVAGYLTKNWAAHLQRSMQGIHFSDLDKNEMFYLSKDIKSIHK